MNLIKTGVLVSAALAASTLVGTAVAAPLISAQDSGVPSFSVLDLGTSTTAGFQSNAAISNPGFDIASITFSGSGSGVYAGDVANVAKSPYGLGIATSTSCSANDPCLNYLVAQANSGAVTITFNHPQTAFDLLWGTADQANGYNVVTNGSDTIQGSDILAATPCSAGSGNCNYAVEVSNLQPFTVLRFTDTTGSAAFEFNIGQPVPEPGSLALVALALAGLGGLGWLSRRSRV